MIPAKLAIKFPEKVAQMIIILNEISAATIRTEHWEESAGPAEKTEK